LKGTSLRRSYFIEAVTIISNDLGCKCLGVHVDITKYMISASATKADWRREKIRYFWDPGRKLLRAIRKYQAAKARGTVFGYFVSKYWIVIHWFWSLVTQSEIPLNCNIEGGLLLPHPTGIVIHPDARIGPNCLIFQQVTLAGEVELGGHCDIGAGAKIIGPVKLGQHVQVGANAVVTRSFGNGSVVIGVPARDIS
jgi:serine O-acetyltransferase